MPPRTIGNALSFRLDKLLSGLLQRDRHELKNDFFVSDNGLFGREACIPSKNRMSKGEFFAAEGGETKF